MLCEEDKLEWKKVLLNVNIISIIAGVVLFIFRIQLPSGAQDVLNMMNNMIGPLGMLLAGMVIAEVPLKTVFTRKKKIPSRSTATAYLSSICFDIDESAPDISQHTGF